jgi:hypothetical protein
MPRPPRPSASKPGGSAPSASIPPIRQKAWRCDWAVFLKFCEPGGVCPLPAARKPSPAFVAHCRGGRQEARHRPALPIHHSARASGRQALNPCVEEAVQLEIKGLYNALSARQRQARALGWAEIKRFLETAGESLPATRERALLCVAYDTMARRSELVALDLEDFDFPARWYRPGADPALEDRPGGGGEYRLPVAHHRPVPQTLARAAGITEGAVFGGSLGGVRHEDMPDGRGTRSASG